MLRAKQSCDCSGGVCLCQCAHFARIPNVFHFCLRLIEPLAGGLIAGFRQCVSLRSNALLLPHAVSVFSNDLRHYAKRLSITAGAHVVLIRENREISHSQKQTKKYIHKMHILFFAYEYCDPIFSGNGTYCRTLVEGLLSVRGDISITVVCASPNGSRVVHVSDRLTVLSVGVQPSQWGRLDRECDFDGYCKGVVSSLRMTPDSNWDRVRNANSDLFFCVDWSGFVALKALAEETSVSFWNRAVYLNFRVFSVGPHSPEDILFFQRWEASAVKECRLTIALSEFDRVSLQRVSDVDTIRILFCPVRSSILDSAKLSTSEMELSAELLSAAQTNATVTNILRAKSRSFVTCCVRLSPEKEPHRFVSFVRGLKGSGYVPLLLGSVANVEYASEVRASLREVFEDDCIILESFVRPEELSSIFRLSVVNVHPCSYDAFGLTITEAAACRCPTLLIKSPSGELNVGATSLLSEGGYIECTESSDIKSLLQDNANLARVSEIAWKRASSYDALACSKKLLTLATAV